MPLADEWYIAGTFTAPDGQASVAQWQAPNDRGAPYERWQVLAGPEPYGLPGDWRGPPQFAADGTFSMELECYGSRYPVMVDPVRKRFTLPAGEEVTLEAFEERVEAFLSTYRELSAQTAEWRRENVGWPVFIGVISLALAAACVVLLLVPVPRPLKPWETWTALVIWVLGAVSSFRDARNELRRRRQRREARESLARLRAAGP